MTRIAQGKNGGPPAGKAPFSFPLSPFPALILFARATVALLLAAATAHAELPEITLRVNGHPVTAEVAANEAHRTKGLMHRRMLPENRGMLFVFPQTAIHGMWMMNTYIPLSVAFIDPDGVITNIADMQPHTRDAHNATRPVRYALEVNQGWFRKRGIVPGMKIEGLERAPPPL